MTKGERIMRAPVTKSQLPGLLVGLLLPPLVGCVSLDGARARDDGEVGDAGEAIAALSADVVIVDVQIVASNLSVASPGPSGYTLLGYWDVGAGGALGTNGSTGSYMTAMYALFRNKTSTSTCVTSVFLDASNSSSLPPTLSPNLVRRGYWDVDDGGAVGGNGTKGSYMTGLYTSSGPVADFGCVNDAQLVASSSSSPPCLGGYSCEGWWDVDRGGGVGTFGSTGSYMMALSTFSF